MKIKSLVQTMALSAVASLMLIGCGGGSDSTPVDTTQTGTFVDAPVKGLRYITATQNGYTNDSGEFSYKSGETVEFRLGNLSLGTVTAGELITPYTIAGDTNISDPSDKATNIAMLLQSFDGNRSNTAMLDVSKLQDANLSDINISATVSDMTTKIANKFADNSFSQYRDTTNNTPVDATTAKNAMKAYVGANSFKFDKKFTQDWLDANTFYMVDNEDGEGNTVPLFILSKQFRNGIGYGDDSAHYGGSAGFKNWGNYTIDANGVIKFTSSNGDGSYYLKINAIYSDYIDIYGSRDGKTFEHSENWYTNKAKAETSLLNSTKKFTANYLNGKTFYMVVKWDTMVRTDDTFNSNGTLAHTNTPDGNFNESWSITSDGKIQVTSGGETFYLTIVSATADYIEVQSNTVNNSGRMYFDQTKANTYKNSL